MIFFFVGADVTMFHFNHVNCLFLIGTIFLFKVGITAFHRPRFQIQRSVLVLSFNEIVIEVHLNCNVIACIVTNEYQSF